MGETSANAATYIAAPMTQPSEPSTEAGKALLAEDYGTTDPRANEPWFEKTRSEYAKRILAIEAEARDEAMMMCDDAEAEAAHEVARLNALLRRYGNHIGDCPQKHGYACICGFADALLQTGLPWTKEATGSHQNSHHLRSLRVGGQS